MSNPKKNRIDLFLVERGYFASREKAKRSILAGEIKVNSDVVSKPGTMIRTDSVIETASLKKYVSRGGEKLAGALQSFSITLKEGLVAIDVGASTGGFTDCLLMQGVAKVYAMDVGYGQLDWSLRNDPRIVVLERKNARYLTVKELGESVDIAVIDVSFISLEKILPPVTDVVKKGGEILALIKPQFEAGPKDVAKGGVVKDEEVRKRVVNRITDFSTKLGLEVLGVTESVLKGPAGNVEYFIYLRK